MIYKFDEFEYPKNAELIFDSVIKEGFLYIDIRNKECLIKISYDKSSTRDACFTIEYFTKPDPLIPGELIRSFDFRICNHLRCPNIAKEFSSWYLGVVQAIKYTYFNLY